MTMVTRWNPFRDFDDIYRAGLSSAQRSNERNYERNYERKDEPAANQANWLPAVDIVETPTDFRLLLEIPAVAAQDVKVAVEDSVLTISGERQAVGVDATPEPASQEAVDIATAEAASGVPEHRHHRRERRFGHFSRSFRLPETVDEEAIDASAKDGVLTLVIAKREQPQPRKIEVKIH